jgi:hypothetical protein
MDEHEIDPTEVEVNNDHFKAWWTYWGLLDTIIDPDIRTGVMMESHIYGFENVSDPTNVAAEVPDAGACFGYVMAGAVTVWDAVNPGDGFVLRGERWFATPGGCRLHVHPRSRVVISQRVGYHGMRAFGGPLEAKGRLKYIDGCSDSILMPPPLLGDPVLNHLHFPGGIEQTEHVHPSTRSGAVARGPGWCETPYGQSRLIPGLVFHIPTNGKHRFLTSHDEMDVIAYHPDSDWGPTDEEHPMVNRTWVDLDDGTVGKVDNTSGRHAQAEVIGR